MARLIRRALCSLGLVVVATACGASGSKGASALPPAGPSPSAGGGAAVTMRLVAFNPEKLEVTRGTTVTWTQTDKGAIHTVTSGTAETDAVGTVTVHSDGRFDSGQLAEGRQFSFTFTEPGTYPYYCVIHQATMRGEVSVR